jgi:hypothetical protein
MKKVILIQVIFMFIITTKSVLAEWELVSFQGDDRVLVDKSSIRKNGEMVMMWSMIDYYLPQKNNLDKPHLSTELYDEYDCRNQSVRYISTLKFSKNSGRGENLSSHTDNNKHFEPINPKSMDETLWKIACGKPR